MTGGDFLLKQQLLCFLGKLQQTQGIRNRGTTLRHRLSNLGLRHVQALHHTAIAVRFLNGIKIGTLDVLDKSKLQSLIIVSFFNSNRHLPQTCQLRCLPTTLAGNDLIRAILKRTHQNRLQKPVFLDRSGKLLQLLALEIRTRLIGVRGNRVDIHFIHFARLRIAVVLRNRRRRYRALNRFLSSRTRSTLSNPHDGDLNAIFDDRLRLLLLIGRGGNSFASRPRLRRFLRGNGLTNHFALRLRFRLRLLRLLCLHAYTLRLLLRNSLLIGTAQQRVQTTTKTTTTIPSHGQSLP